MNGKKLERREIVGGIIVSLQIIENGYFMCYFGFDARHNPRFELVENLDTTYPSLQSKIEASGWTASRRRDTV
jgi:hypothetical protein